MKRAVRKTQFMLVAAAAGAIACSESVTGPQPAEEAPLLILSAASSASWTSVDFVLGPFVLVAPGDARPAGKSGRLHIKDYLFVGPVSGDLGEGEAEVLLSVPFDATFSGPVIGKLTITLNDGSVWSGNLTGEAIGLQTFLTGVIHGPMQQRMQVTCTETSPNSETSDCSGELLNPHG